MNSSQYLNGIIILITILAMYCNELSIKIDMECDFGGSDIPRVCVFIEVFEDEPMYEQLLRNHSRCIITDLIHFSRELENKDYFYPEGEKHRVRVGIPPIKFRKVLRNHLQENLTMFVQISHDCSSNRKIRCFETSLYYNTTISKNEIFITDKLKDQGRMRACSPRWEGSELWNGQMLNGRYDQ
ncbi:uncharacterized protein CELE_F56H1.10 [Caenorhabditis elegans]|uniref:Secreted protein n=1 Tax=Caenorhabditis elegans TaxID=6239 RepID=E4MVD3_CAEEL|nr:Secreted protein [Caenorhabditis elegans]CCD62971.1 Secreted protein [Caenorhabditis elegans]|eukprot:NP_001249983.1 Uncharacterized protein CELE_F56H1.10 [Caenorhabditis elegans]